MWSGPAVLMTIYLNKILIWCSIQIEDNDNVESLHARLY